jgi:uncharacterized BrkB/YihY/UPF0761 family membrane protein
MRPNSLVKKLFRTLARVIPQCGMVSQAVAFNMFLAFFAVLLTALSLMKSSLEGEGGQEVAMRISAILPPGGWPLISAYMLRQEVNAWYLALIGWVGTLLVGSQVIKLIIKGIDIIYGDHGTDSFLGRQLRGLLLFSITIVAWLVAVALSVFGRSLRQWIIPGFEKSQLIRGLWYVILPVLAMLVLALIYRLARPGTTTWSSVLPGAACGRDSVVGRQFALWNLRSEDEVWICIRWTGSGDRFDGVDGALCDDRLYRCGLERGKLSTGRLRLHHWLSGNCPLLHSSIRLNMLNRLK